MNLTKGNINMVNEMIDNDPHSEVTQGIIDTLKGMESQLIEQTQKVADEDLLAIILAVNDDLHTTLERYNAVRQGLNPKPFVPCENKQNLRKLTPTHLYDPSKKSSPEKQAPADILGMDSPSKVHSNSGKLYDSNMGDNNDLNWKLDQILKA